MNIEILNNDAAYLAYMKKVNGMTHALPKAGQLEIQKEIRSHIYESLLNSPGLSVEGALQKFGEPDVYLPEWVVLKKMEKAVNSFDPIRIFRALFLGIRRHTAHAFKYSLFGLLYLFAAAFAVLGMLKVFLPANTGLFIFPHGIIFGSTDKITGSYEVLGWWFIPICLFIAAMLYIWITNLLKNSLKQ